MAKYINRENLDFLNDFCIDSGKYAGLRLNEVFDELATADLIELSEYEKIKFERDISMQQIHNLGSSVIKAIEEIEQTTNTYLGSLMHESTKETILKILREIFKCTDCNEYNQEKHYCPKFCDVIRDTTKEIQEFYKGEHEKLEDIEQIVKDYGLSEIDLTNEDLSDSERDFLREILEQE